MTADDLKPLHLAERLGDPKTSWRRVTATGWYGRTERPIELISGTALWYHPGKQVLIRWLLVRDVAGEFEPQGFLCTDPDVDPLDVLHWFVWRWSVEVTFAEVRRHLGVETQRQWSDLAIARTTPVLLGLFSLVTLWAKPELDGDGFRRRAAWYPKHQPSFSDALAAVRHRLWPMVPHAAYLRRHCGQMKGDRNGRRSGALHQQARSEQPLRGDHAPREP